MIINQDNTLVTFVFDWAHNTIILFSFKYVDVCEVKCNFPTALLLMYTFYISASKIRRQRRTSCVVFERISLCEYHFDGKLELKFSLILYSLWIVTLTNLGLLIRSHIINSKSIWSVFSQWSSIHNKFIGFYKKILKSVSGKKKHKRWGKCLNIFI